MPVGRAVQFKGSDAVAGAYEANRIPAFAIAYDKNIFFRYCENSVKEGKELLAGYLEMLEKHDSKAIYTLRLYEGLKGKIKNNTPYDMSFNFKLDDGEEESMSGTSSMQVSTGHTAQLLSLMKELSKEQTERAITQLKLKQLEEAIENQPESEERSIGSQLMEQLIPVLGQIGSALGQKFFGGPAPAAAMAGASIETGSDQDDERIANAIEVMQKHWTSKYTLPDVMERLAVLTRDHNDQFNFYLGHLMR